MEKVKTMVRDPQFQALPWNERHQLLTTKDPGYAALSPQEQVGVMNSLKTKDWWKPAPTAQTTEAPLLKNNPKRYTKYDELMSNVFGEKFVNYAKNTPQDGTALENLPRSALNTVYNLGNLPVMGYEGISEGTLKAQRGKLTPEQKGEYDAQTRQAAKSLTAPFGLSGSDAFKESWNTAPVQSLMTVAPLIGPVAKTGLRGAAKTIDIASGPFKRRITPEAQNLINFAGKKGVPLSPTDITGSRFQGLTETMLNNIPTSAPLMQGFRENQLGAYAANAVKPVMEKMGAKGKTFAEVGNAARDATVQRSKILDKLVARKFDKARQLFPKQAVSTIDETAPWRPSSFTEPGGIPTAGTKDIVRKIMQEEAEVIKPLKDTEAVSVLKELADTDSMSFSAVQRNLSRMKDIIRSNDKGNATGGKFQSNSTAGAFKRIVRRLEDDVDSFAAEHGGAFEEAWHEARNTARAGYELFDSRRIRQVMNAEPSQLVNHFRTKNADSIHLIKKAVGPRSFDQLRGAWIESLVKTNEKGQIRPASLGNALGKIDEGTLKAIFRPDELKELREIGKLGQSLQGAEKLAGNPSGTGQSLLTPGFWASIGGMVISGNVPAAAAALFTPPVMAKLYLSKAGRKYLTEGFKIKPDTPRADAWLRKGTFLANKVKDERGMIGDIGDAELLVNPTRNELNKALHNSRYKELRVVKDPATGDVYAADAGSTYHKFMAQKAGLDWSKIDGNPEYMFTIDRNGISKAIRPSAIGDILSGGNTSKSKVRNDLPTWQELHKDPTSYPISEWERIMKRVDRNIDLEEIADGKPSINYSDVKDWLSYQKDNMDNMQFFREGPYIDSVLAIERALSPIMRQEGATETIVNDAIRRNRARR